MERIKIELKDRRGDTIFTDASIDPTSSVFELKKHLLRACEKLSKFAITDKFKREKRNWSRKSQTHYWRGKGCPALRQERSPEPVHKKQGSCALL